MPGIAVAICNAVLNELDGTATWTPPAALYLALGTRSGNNFTELAVSGAYARTLCTAAFGGAAGGIKANDAAITTPESTADRGSITAFALYSAATAGAIVAMGPLDTPQNYNTGVTFEFAIGALEVEMTPGAVSV